MKYAVFAPTAELNEVIRYYWVLECVPNSATPPVYQEMADSSPELIFQYNGGYLDFGREQGHFIAQKSINRSRILSKEIGMFGIRFFPHASQLLIKGSSVELTNKTYNLIDIIGNSAKTLVEQINNSLDTTERIEFASAFFKKMLKGKQTDPIRKIVKEMMLLDGEVSIRKMQEITQLSERQFERRFLATTGFTPRHMARILRFQSTKRKYITCKFPSLSELAHGCGYYDQSHFIREFKEFSGMNPKAYFDLLDSDAGAARIIKGLSIPKDTFSESDRRFIILK
ncbi:MAG TPA: helix-turn-helix domain-containing protein [Cyclobacteriaceae bacterium]